jgi:hypothetical protein
MPQYFVTMIEDINNQKHAAEELRQSQAPFSIMLPWVAVMGP